MAVRYLFAGVEFTRCGSADAGDMMSYAFHCPPSKNENKLITFCGAPTGRKKQTTSDKRPKAS